MDNVRFDAWMRVLGQRASRRGALATLAALTGLALGERAAATKGRSKRRRETGRGRKAGHVAAQAKPGNSDCARFCKAVFPPGRDRGRCISEAAHGEGLCHECRADPSIVCSLTDGSFACCDATGGVCHNGECCTPRTCGTACTYGVLDPGCGLPPIDCAQACEPGRFCEIRPGLGLTCCDCGFGACGGNGESTCPDGDQLNPGSGGPSTCPGDGGDGGDGGNAGGGSGGDGGGFPNDGCPACPGGPDGGEGGPVGGGGDGGQGPALNP